MCSVSDSSPLFFQGRSFAVHRLILAFSSEVCAQRLKGSASGARLVLDFPDPDNVMPDILRYMYTGEITITAEKAVPLLTLADKLRITELKAELSEFISKNVRRENAVTLLKKALQFQDERIANRCVTVVAANFAYLYDVTYDYLPYALFAKLVSHKYLNVLREFDLFTHIRRYVVAHPELTEEQRNLLWQQTRYRWLTIDELIEIMHEGLVPQALLLEATFARLEQHEQGSRGAVGADAESLPDRLQPRPLFPVSIRFRPAEKGITPGIIDWIGRNAGRREWENPHLSSDVIVSASSLCKGVLQDLVNHQENELWSKDVPASWFSIDFGPNRTVIASHYTLRHGGNYRADTLRNWDFQGSNDGLHWETLMSHRQDSSLQGPFAIASWELPKYVATEGKQKSFRYFRVIQTGHNSSSRNFLVLSNIEIFGKLFDCSMRVAKP